HDTSSGASPASGRMSWQIRRVMNSALKSSRSPHENKMPIAPFGRDLLILIFVTEVNVQLPDEPVQVAARDKQILPQALALLPRVTAFQAPVDRADRMPVVAQHHVVVSHALVAIGPG